MKIKNIRLNGTSYALDDQDAIEIPEGVELQDGDVLVYNELEESFECINRNSLVDVEKGVVENSQKLVKSGDVYTAIDSAINTNPCNLDIDYDNVNGKFIFHVASGSPSSLNVNVSLLVLSINTHYDSVQQELAFSNIVTILHLDKNTSSVEYLLDQYIDDRQFYFILINNSQNVQTCILNRDTILVPGVNEKTNVILTPSFISPDDVNAISVVSSVAVDTDITIVIDIIEPHANRRITGTLLAGTSQVNINIGDCGYNRSCGVSITPVSVSSTQNYILQNAWVSVPANLGLKELVAVADSQSPRITVRTIDGYLVNEDIIVNLVLPRNGTSPVIVNGTILAGTSEVNIGYVGIGFSGPIVNVGVDPSACRDQTYDFYFENTSIQLIVDGNGNPY